MAKGFYVQNNTMNKMHIRSGDKVIDDMLEPKGERGDTMFVSSANADDASIVKLLDRKLIVRVDEGRKAVAETEQAREDAREALEQGAIKLTEDVSGLDLIEVPCDAITRQGTKCRNRAAVAKNDEFKGPHFCGVHDTTDPADYEFVDGAWALKS